MLCASHACSCIQFRVGVVAGGLGAGVDAAAVATAVAAAGGAAPAAAVGKESPEAYSAALARLAQIKPLLSAEKFKVLAQQLMLKQNDAAVVTLRAFPSRDEDEVLVEMLGI